MARNSMSWTLSRRHENRASRSVSSWRSHGAHFVKNMFIRPTDAELKYGEPDFELVPDADKVNLQ